MDPIFYTYASLSLMAIIPIYVGARASIQYNKDKKQENTEQLSLEDAKMFPIYGSISLFSLYLLFKYFDKELVNYLLTAYFVVIGMGAMTQVLLSLSRYVTGLELKGDYEFTFKGKEKTIFEISFGYYHILLLILSGGFSGLYVWTKDWILSNIYGEIFSITAIQFMELDSFKTGMVLLGGLFFYDIFWVFGTEVMVNVAKNFDAPIKVLFPKNIIEFVSQGIFRKAVGKEFSLLGLGDIVLPGVYVALSLQYDYHCYCKTAAGKKNPKTMKFPKPYFYASFISYILGLATTMTVMHTFKAAQPALLYLSPACILSTLLVGAIKKDLGHVFAFINGEEQEAKKKKEK